MISVTIFTVNSNRPENINDSKENGHTIGLIISSLSHSSFNDCSHKFLSLNDLSVFVEHHSNLAKSCRLRCRRISFSCLLDLGDGYGGAENTGGEKAGVEKSGVDSRGGKCRSEDGWKAVRKEKYKIPMT